MSSILTVILGKNEEDDTVPLPFSSPGRGFLVVSEKGLSTHLCHNLCFMVLFIN